jgi:hypothetical protein
VFSNSRFWHLFAYGCENSLKGLDRALFADPKQKGDAQINLINQGQILVPFGVSHFIDAIAAAS